MNRLWIKFQMLRLMAAGESASKKGNRLIFNFKVDKMIRDLESTFESRQQVRGDLAIIIRILRTKQPRGYYTIPEPVKDLHSSKDFIDQ
jgi:hypothetical protein